MDDGEKSGIEEVNTCFILVAERFCRHKKSAKPAFRFSGFLQQGRLEDFTPRDALDAGACSITGQRVAHDTADG